MYAENLCDSGKEYQAEVELVETILKRNFLRVSELHAIKLKKLRKLMEGKDTTKEDYEWL